MKVAHQIMITAVGEINCPNPQEAIMGGMQRVKRMAPILQDTNSKLGFLHRLDAWSELGAYPRGWIETSDL